MRPCTCISWQQLTRASTASSSHKVSALRPNTLPCGGIGTAQPPHLLTCLGSNACWSHADGDENADPCTPQLTVKITQLPTATCVSKQNTNSPNSGGPLRQYMRWLGFWRPEFDAFTRIEELLMQVRGQLQRMCCCAFAALHLQQQ